MKSSIETDDTTALRPPTLATTTRELQEVVPGNLTLVVRVRLGVHEEEQIFVVQVLEPADVSWHAWIREIERAEGHNQRGRKITVLASTPIALDVLAERFVQSHSLILLVVVALAG